MVILASVERYECIQFFMIIGLGCQDHISFPSSEFLPQALVQDFHLYSLCVKWSSLSSSYASSVFYILNSRHCVNGFGLLSVQFTH